VRCHCHRNNRGVYSRSSRVEDTVRSQLTIFNCRRCQGRKILWPWRCTCASDRPILDCRLRRHGHPGLHLLQDILRTHPGMDVNYASLPTFKQLRDHVHTTLCSRDRIDPGQTSLRYSLIVRSGKPCGLFFLIQGPRLLRTHAVWAREEERILLYDSRGLRFAETRLCEAPQLEEAAA